MTMANVFVGVKVIKAEPMTRAAYNAYRGWELPADENGDDAGYLVEYLDGGTANVAGHKGYVSWSPQEVFDNTYRGNGHLTFGMALEAIKQGYRVTRTGWNGKDMWIAMGQGKADNPAEQFWNPHAKQHAINHGGKADVLPYVIMKTAFGAILMGWLASQSDLFSEDWSILENT